MDGERLRKAMKERGFTQDRLADEALLTQKTISNYVTGKRGKYFEILKEICMVLNVSADYLIGLTDEMEVRG